VLILFHLVRRWFGDGAGLMAALVLAVTPVSVAIDRSNNLDSLLILTLLLAAWAFIRATESGRWRDLLLGALVVGIGFNIKMLQAYLVVPAFFALYLLGANVPWRRKAMQLAAAAALVLAVSISWALVVDLTPADQRPYVGGSQTNSVLELAFGYNGVERLLGGAGPGGSGPGAPVGPGARTAPPAPPGASDGSGGRPAGGPAAAAPGGADEIGTAGPTRLISPALANELAWLLPFSLLGLGLLAASARLRLPLGRDHQAAVLWGGWLLTGVVFFSVSSFFHAYYLATIAPPVAALTGIGLVRLWGLARARPRFGSWLVAGVLLFAIGWQVFIASQYVTIAPAAVLLLAGLLAALAVAGVVAWRGPSRALQQAAAALAIASLVIVPALWSIATVATTDAFSATLPAAYAGADDASSQMALGAETITEVLALVARLIEASPAGTTTDVVVPIAMIGSQIILGSDITVRYAGGFNGLDAIYSVEGFSEAVAQGEIGYVLGSTGQSAVDAWVRANCGQVDAPELEATLQAAMGSLGAAGGVMPPGATGASATASQLGAPASAPSDGLLLYRCGGG
jgi:4-amino-4-deoxy-L-arabinose transferase-like glycosyltransferase